MHGRKNIKLQYLFVHMLVYNKQLLFNMHGMNIKVTSPTVFIKLTSTVVNRLIQMFKHPYMSYTRHMFRPTISAVIGQ